MDNQQVQKSTNDSKQTKETAASGGRSEKQAQQRNAEQANADHDKSAEVPREAVHNVKSEPHWDPAEKPAQRDANGK